MQHVSPSLPLTKRFARLALALLITAAAVPAFAEDSIYLSSFEASEVPPAAAWSFDNVTASSLDQILDSDYRIDATFVDFNNDGCYDLFVFGHADPSTSRLWVNRCDGSNTFT